MTSGDSAEILARKSSRLFTILLALKVHYKCMISALDEQTRNIYVYIVNVHQL